MAKRQIIDIGIQGNDGTGDSIRESFRKVNENFNDLYAIFGSGDSIGFSSLADAPGNHTYNIVSGSGNGSTVTLNFTNPNPSLGSPFTIGQNVIIKQVVPSEFNGTYVVSNTTPTSITYSNNKIGTVSKTGIITENSYGSSQLLMSSTTGDRLTARSVIAGDGIIIDKNSNSTLTISASVAGLSGDTHPQLGNAFNVNFLPMGRVAEPSQAVVDSFNAIWSSYGNHNIVTQLKDLPVTVGYGDKYYVKKNPNGTISGPLRARPEPSIPQINDIDYDPSLTSNYLSTEVMQRKDVVYRGGDTMTGKLYLSDHPAPLEGLGTPNGETDLQAATTFYVDNSSFSSNVNLYVSTSKGDDLQQKTPVGKEGRFWNYAYQTIGAACLQAQNLISIASQEPGPYKQRLSFTTNNGIDQNFTTVHSVELIDGKTNTVDSADFIDAYNLLQANKEFIQAETIAYINKKYVNVFTYDKSKCSRDIGYILDGIGYDIVLDSTYNTYKSATAYYYATAANVLNGELIQTIDAITYIRDTLLGYTYDSNKLVKFINQLITSIAYDLVFQSNYRSIRTGQFFKNSGTLLSSDQIVKIIDPTSIQITSVSGNGSEITLYFNDQASAPFKIGDTVVITGLTPSSLNGKFEITNCTSSSLSFVSNVLAGSSSNGKIMPDNLAAALLGFTSISVSTQCTNSVIANLTIMVDIIKGSLAPEISIPSIYNTSVGKESARNLILNNISFIQSEINAYLTIRHSGVEYDKLLSKRDIKYISESLVYDSLYGGDSQSIYSGLKFWENDVLSLSSFQTAACIDSITYLNTVLQGIISNTKIEPYQHSVLQYTNDTLVNGSVVSTSISDNITKIKTIISTGIAPIVHQPSISGISTVLTTAFNQITNATNIALVESIVIDYINFNFSIINQSYSGTITNLFQIIIDTLSNGVSNIDLPVYTIPDGTPSNTSSSVSSIMNNLTVLSDGVANWISVQYPAFDYNGNPTTGVVKCKRDVKILLEAICYDLMYGGNSASVFAGSQFWLGNTSNLPNQLSICSQSISHLRDLVLDITNVSLSSVITSLFGDIINGLNNNSSITPIYPDLSQYSQELKDTRSVIITNKITIANDTLKYIDTNYSGGFNYNESLCFRDLGYIVDAMSIDLITGGTWQTINAGRSFYKNSSAKSIAIGTDKIQSLDGIEFAKKLAVQILTLDNSPTRFQSLKTQKTVLSGTLPTDLINVLGASHTPIPNADIDVNGQYCPFTSIGTLLSNMNTLISIISNGIGIAPELSPLLAGTGRWQLFVSNGGNGYLDQGAPSKNHIIPGKVMVGVGNVSTNIQPSNAYGNITKYEPNKRSGYDMIELRMTKPGFFKLGEVLEFGEVVPVLNITVFIESGVYYEHYPIRIPANVSLKGDEMRRTIVRPIDGISQSVWNNVFFYRDAIIDGMEIGKIDYDPLHSIAPSGITAHIDGVSNKIVVALSNATAAPFTWVGKVFADNNISSGNDKRGRAVIDSVSGNALNCTVIYPFSEPGTFAAGDWFIFDSINYGHHYLSDPSDANSIPKNNKDMDVFLCNDSNRIIDMTIQGHGGFALVLDPTGNVVSKSPYIQLCSSFARSTGYKRFTGGIFVDGFTGRVYGTITSIDDDGFTLTVVGEQNSGLDIRAPQAPCVFYVQGKRYQVDDIKSYDKNTATVVLTLHSDTPYLYDIYGTLVFDEAKTSRDVGYIVDAITSDMVLGTNFRSIQAGRALLRSYSSALYGDLLGLTLAGIKQSGVLAAAETSNNTAKQLIIQNTDLIYNMLSSEKSDIHPVWSSTTDTELSKAHSIISSNIKFIQSEITSWISANYNVRTFSGYNHITSQRDIGFIVESMLYDLLYGGNSQTKEAASAFWRTENGTIVSYIPNENTLCTSALSRLKTIMPYIIAGDNSGWAKSVANQETQIVANSPSSPGTFQTTISVLMDILLDYVSDGDYDTSTTTIYPSLPSGTLKTAYNTIQNNISSISDNILTYLKNGAEQVINIEMAGNRSIFSNDFANFNDLGYGVVATNGAFSEQVSTFSYYAHTGFWASNGANIRAIGCSNSFGDYGIRASGYDVTELPDSVKLANNMVQTAYVYKRGLHLNDMEPTTNAQATAVYIYGYEYPPTTGSELEIDHSIVGGTISKYVISNITPESIVINGQNVLKLDLSSSGANNTSTTGLTSALYDRQLITIRILNNVKFKNVDNVRPTRPSTALQYTSDLNSIYRIINYNLVESTGEALAPNIAILQSDNSFSYFTFTVDNFNIDNIDPDDNLKTQGSMVGDNKIAVVGTTNQKIIDQINNGKMIIGYNGRTHRVINYTQALYSATGTVISSGGWDSITSTLNVNNVLGTIEIGTIITGSGFDGTQTVLTVIYDQATVITSITVSNSSSVSTPSGTITFGVNTNSYMTIDPIPLVNNADSADVNALSYVSNKLQPSSTTAKLITFDIPYRIDNLLPAVDSYITISNSTNPLYNGAKQITNITTQTQITIANTHDLEVGMIVKNSSGAYVPDGSIIQSIDSATTYTVTPACWAPSGSILTSVLASIIASITVQNAGANYSVPPTISISGGGAIKNAIATCTVTNGKIDGVIKIINPGYGYTDVNTIVIIITPAPGDRGAGAVLVPHLNNPIAHNTTTTDSITTTTMTLLYPDDPGTSGYITNLASSGNFITLNTVDNLSVNNEIIFTFTGNFGNLVSSKVYYITSVSTNKITISETLGGISINPGDVIPINNNYTFYTPSFSFGESVNITGFVSKTVYEGGESSGESELFPDIDPYDIVYTIPSSSIISGKFYKVSGNSNPLYNGYFLCTSATSSSATSITLRYPNDPGLYGTGTTTLSITPITGSSLSYGISKPFNYSTPETLHLGFASDESGQITQRISTCRATAHDFCDIGTGSYITTNIPYIIYGNPSSDRKEIQETVEEGVGRCFYVSTNQDGVFKVGRFFKVDQGSGNVTINAGISLSNLSGFGFKRGGVVVSEFSADPTMIQDATDIVPVQYAVRGFVDRRLGLDYSGAPVPAGDLIGPGFMSLGGSLAMKNNMNLGNNHIVNLAYPLDTFQASNKGYVDDSTYVINSLHKLLDVSKFEGSGFVFNADISSNTIILKNFAGTIENGFIAFGTGLTAGQTVNSYHYNSTTKLMTIVLDSAPDIVPVNTITFTSPTLSNGSVLTFDSSISKWRNSSLPTGDVNTTYNAGLFTTTIQSNKIVDSMINNNAAISQSKLALNAATTRSSATGINQSMLGVSSFNNLQFTSDNGWISVQSASSQQTGITYDKIQHMAQSTVMGRGKNAGTGAAGEITFGNVVSGGDGIKNASFGSGSTVLSGYAMLVSYDGISTANNTYSILGLTTQGEPNKLVKTNSSGGIDVSSLSIDNYKIIDVAGNNVNFTTPGGSLFMSSAGTSGSNTTTTFSGIVDTSGATLRATDITSGGTSIQGTITGDWLLSANSMLDLNTHQSTLRAYNITTDGTDTGVGTIQGYWSLTGASRLQATYADLAEYYEGDYAYEPGTVVVFGGDKEITKSSIVNDSRVAGVVTTNPAYIMNSGQAGIAVCIALAGRIPCKVIGKVKKGDLLTTSNVPGHAIKANDPKIGTIIGKSLVDKDTGEAGVIEIAVGRS